MEVFESKGPNFESDLAIDKKAINIFVNNIFIYIYLLKLKSTHFYLSSVRLHRS